MGNGNRAAMKRERNAKDTKTAGSQLKTNEKAKSTQCKTCLQTFLLTVREQQLREHVTNKHSTKKFEDCFPGWVATA